MTYKYVQEPLQIFLLLFWAKVTCSTSVFDSYNNIVMLINILLTGKVTKRQDYTDFICKNYEMLVGLKRYLTSKHKTRFAATWNLSVCHLARKYMILWFSLLHFSYETWVLKEVSHHPAQGTGFIFPEARGSSILPETMCKFDWFI